MTFQIGDKVVYPNQGVGTIENISARSFGSAFEKFYLLRFGCNSMTVVVPFSNAANIGLRRITKDREIARIFSFLSNGWVAVHSDWKVRFKEHARKMQSGDLLKAAEVFKGLLQLHVDKPLSFHEKRMLDRARHMLVSEISIARHVPEIHALSMLQRSLAKAGLTLPPVLRP
jgi:CarD family transcriptional regulator